MTRAAASAGSRCGRAGAAVVTARGVVPASAATYRSRTVVATGWGEGVRGHSRTTTIITT